MNEEFVRVLRVADVAVGGMKAATLNGREIVVCNSGGSFHAIDRRCGHMSAPLEMDTLDGTIVTCPMHCAQFDATSGEAISGPGPSDLGGEIPPPRTAALLKNVGALMAHIRTENVRPYRTKVESEWILVAPSPEP